MNTSRQTAPVLAALLFVVVLPVTLRAATPEELRIKRESVFEFASKPSVTRAGDRYTISFESKAACDVTVAIEDTNGKIVRHLASGVLGEKAPPPLKRGTLKQTLAWDGKNDQGKYIDEIDSLKVRVSLGLKPMYERDLLRSNKKRFSQVPAIVVPQPEGVYVYDGGAAMDFLRLYDHEGNYVRTIYPFPADKLTKVKGLIWHTAVQDGARHPVKPNFLQNTLLTSGDNCVEPLCYDEKLKRYTSGKNVKTTAHYGMYGRGVMSMAVRAGRIALANQRLNRIGTDGSSGGMMFPGPSSSMVIEDKKKKGNSREQERLVPPNSAALSPDGKTLYLAGYIYPRLGNTASGAFLNLGYQCYQGVYKLSMDKDTPMELFAGSGKRNDLGDGKSKGRFGIPSCVAVDEKGLLYVGDYLNDRVQIFDPKGTFLRSFPVKRPSQITLDSKRDEIYVFSFLIHNGRDQKLGQKNKVPATLTLFKKLAEPRKVATMRVPTINYWDWCGRYRGHPYQLAFTVDTHAAEPIVWVSEGYQRDSRIDRGKVKHSNIRLYTIEKNKFVLKRDFHKDVEKSVKRATRSRYARQRLSVNPVNGKLYVAEGDAATFKSFKALLEINPRTGKTRVVDIPFDAEDFCFDHDGFGYLRTMTSLVRYDPRSWREVPWDYGEERGQVCTSSSSDRRVAAVVSAIALPVTRPDWHQGGMYVDLNGNVVAACGWRYAKLADRRDANEVNKKGGYTPNIYPGRSVRGRGGMPVIHVWDRHGKLIRKDAIPGVSGQTYGLGLDASGAITAMVSDTRIYEGEKYYNDLSGTLIRFLPGKTRIVCDGDKSVPLPLNRAKRPKRAKDIGSSWVEGAEWYYGGVGWDGKNAGIGCGCWNARFAYDYFSRSFAPELDRYRIAVLDSAGNLILRVGRYGNADSAGPASRVPLGGDEVGLVHGAYVATHTDQRLFIADPANERIVSVKLGYHQSEDVALKGLPNRKGLADSKAASPGL